MRALLCLVAFLAATAPVTASSINELTGPDLDWDTCSSWTGGCPANHPALAAVVNYDVTFDTTDPKGYVASGPCSVSAAS